MVNLEEILGENKLFYEPPRMTIKRIDFSDILTTSGGVGEPTDPNRPPSSDTPPGQEYDPDDPFG